MTMETPRQPHNRRSRKAGKSTSRPPFAVVRSTPSRRIPRLSARRKRWIYLVLGSIIAQMNRKDPKHHLASVHPSTTWVDVRLSCSTAATVRRRRWRAGLRQNEGNVRDLRSAPPRAVYPRTLLNPDAPCLEYYIFPKNNKHFGVKYTMHGAYGQSEPRIEKPLVVNEGGTCFSSSNLSLFWG